MRRRHALVGLLVAPRAAWACGRLELGQILRGRFVQTRRLQGFARPLVTEGRFALAPGQGLIWRAEKPFAITTVMSAAGLVQETRGTETLRLPAARLPLLARLYDMLGGALGGDWHALERDFSVLRTGDAAAWQVVLTPRVTDSIAMPFQAITAHGGCFVDAVDLAKPGGDTDRLEFLDQTLAPGPLGAGEEAALAVLAR